MYHDQALIPIKTLDFWDGVNVTLGLPIVRTSPDHGTAFDIAGQRQGRSPQHDRGDPHGRRRSPHARRPCRVSARRPAAAARGDRARTAWRPRNRWARISCSTSISPRRIARAAGAARRRHVLRGRPGPRRAYPRAACRRRAQSDRGRARRTLPARAGRDRRRLARQAGDHFRRRAGAG